MPLDCPQTRVNTRFVGLSFSGEMRFSAQLSPKLLLRPLGEWLLEHNPAMTRPVLFRGLGKSWAEFLRNLKGSREKEIPSLSPQQRHPLRRG